MEGNSYNICKNGSTLFELVIAIYALQMVCTISSPNKEFDRHVPIECFCNVITQIP